MNASFSLVMPSLIRPSPGEPTWTAPDLEPGLANPGYIVAAIVVTALVTLTMRALPFALPERVLRESRLIADLNSWMPLGLVLILAMYSLSNTSSTSAPHGVPELLALVVTVGLHVWRANALLSIVAGSLTYLVLVNAVL